MKQNKIFIMMMMLLLVLIPLDSTHANEVDPQKAFSVSPLNPETNQPQSSYYDLFVKPNETRQLKVRIFNSASEDINVDVAANDGTTNDNGITSYLGNQERDASLKVAFSDIAKVEQEQVTIAKNSSVDAVITIDVPEQAFEGAILGGIRVTSATAENTKENKAKAGVANNVAYTVGVLLREDNQEFDPQMNLLQVKTEQRNYRNYISANLQNAAPRIIKKLTASAQVYKKGESTILYEAANSEMRMAPNSNFNFGINLEDQPFKPGKYTMKISGAADGKDFSFEKDFEIKTKEAKKWNKNAVFVENQPQDATWLYVGIGALVLLIIGLISYLIYSKKGGKKRNEKT